MSSALAASGGPPFDLVRPRRIHLVGIGGAGMSAYAVVLAALGHQVSGSDLKQSPALDRLQAAGVEVAVGHRQEHVAGAGLVAVSSAVPDDNPEVVAARAAGVPVVSRADLLAAITTLRRTVAVAGTHGKTTTTSMLALILVEAGLHPSFLIGGDVNEIGTNAMWDHDGEWLVVEADESDGTFLRLDAELAVVTNVEADHLDHYGDFATLRQAFAQFCRERPGGVVVGSDDPEATALGAAVGAELVGSAGGSTISVADLHTSRDGVRFTLRRGGSVLCHLALPVLGAHNARNAAVAAVAANRIGAPWEAAERALARFAGVARRFEFRGEAAGVRFVDDYAHLPAEVAAALEAARSGGWSRLVVVFQPHRYSRTAALGEAFGTAFEGADVVVVTDVYPAGEAPVPGVTGRLVADAIRRAQPAVEVHFVGGREDLVEQVHRLLRPGDLCLTLGAGDLTSLADELLAAPRW